MNQMIYRTLPKACKVWVGLLVATGAMISHSEALAEDAKAPTADRANYRGDCLRVTTAIKPAEGESGTGLKDASLLYVVSQSDDGKSLNVMKGKALLDGLPVIGGLFCGPAQAGPNASMTKVSVQDVVDSGARRRGWVYGMLLTPYKYYPRSRQLVGASSIGPYLGSRTEGAQGALTLVASAGMGNVTGTSTDANGATKEVSLASLSLSTGAIIEVSKSKNPFRLGLLVGQDRVRPGTGVTYENNGKTWLALQLGFDFTDF